MKDNDSDDFDFNLADYIVSDEMLQEQQAAARVAREAKSNRPKTKRSRTEGWLPLPLAAAKRLSGASGAAWAVYICLLELEFRSWVKGQPLTLSNIALNEWNVSRGQKRRALTELETLGLIRAESFPNKAPQITLASTLAK